MFSQRHNYTAHILATLLLVVMGGVVWGSAEVLAQGDLNPVQPEPQTELVTTNVGNQIASATGNGCFVSGTWIPAVGWECISSVIAAIFGGFLIITMLIFWLTALFFNASVLYTVVGMGALLKNPDASLIAGISVTWTVIRDVANLIFMFGLVFIGINTILGISKYGYKQLLVRLIVAALLINFSLVFATLIVDTTNLLATRVFQVITLSDQACQAHLSGSDLGASSITADAGMACLQNGIAGVLGNATLISSVASGDALQAMNAEEASSKNLIQAGLYAMTIIVVGTLAFLMMTGGIMLVTRFAVLVVLMVFSPIAFAGMVLPYTSKLSSDWWDKFIKNALFAPAFLLLLWVAFAVMNSLGGALGTGTLSNLFAGQAAVVSVLINYTVAIILLVAAIIMASNFGVYGAQTSRALGKRWSRNLTWYAYSGAMRGPQAALGGTARRTQNLVNRMEGKIDQMEGNKGRAARFGRKLISVGSGGLLARDAVNLGLESAQNTTLGTTGSYRDNAKRSTEQTRIRARQYKQGQIEGSLGRLSTGTQYYDNLEAKELLAGMSDDDQAKYKRANDMGDMGTANEMLEKAREKRKRDDIGALQSIGVKDIEDGTYTNILGNSLLENKNVAQHFSTKQAEGIRDSDNITAGSKDTFAKNRFANLKDELKTISAEEDKLREAEFDLQSKMERHKAAEDAGNAALATQLQTQIDSQKTVVENQEKAIQSAAKAVGTKVKPFVENLKPQDKAKLGIDILSSRAVAPHLNNEDLRALAREKGMTDSDRASIYRSIRKSGEKEGERFNDITFFDSNIGSTWIPTPEREGNTETTDHKTLVQKVKAAQGEERSEKALTRSIKSGEVMESKDDKKRRVAKNALSAAGKDPDLVDDPIEGPKILDSFEIDKGGNVSYYGDPNA